MTPFRTIASSLLLLGVGCTPTERTPTSGAEPEREQPAAEASPYLGDIVQVDAARAITCALTSHGAVYCWGQLTEVAVKGRRAAPLFGMAATRPVRVPGPPATRIAVSERRVSMLDADGSLLVAGEFDSSWPTTDTFRATGAKNVRLLFKSPGRTAPLCWLTEDSVMGCDTGDQRIVPPGFFVDARAQGCLANADSMQCTRGYRTVGALQDGCVTDGDPNLEGRDAYRFAISGRPAALYESQEGGCVLTEGGAVQCVGKRFTVSTSIAGARGESETSSSRSSIDDRGPFADLAVGPMGRALTYGLVADGSVIDFAAEATVPDTGFVTALSSSSEHTCGLRADSKVVCWGANLQGQLGTGQERDRSRAELVLAPEQPQTQDGPRIARPTSFGFWSSGGAPETPPPVLCPLVVPDVQ